MIMPSNDVQVIPKINKSRLCLHKQNAYRETLAQILSDSREKTANEMTTFVFGVATLILWQNENTGYLFTITAKLTAKWL